MADKNGMWEVEAVQTPGGNTYYRYKKDENGKKIMKKGVDPEAAKPKTGKKSKANIYKTETVETPSGQTYQRYLRDENGKRILRDDLDPEILEALKSEKKNGGIKKASRSARRRIVPDHIVLRMKSAISLRSSYEDNKKDTYRVVVDEQFVTGEDTGWVIVAIDKSYAQEVKYIFFNLYSGEWLDFNKEVHKPGRGNEAIIWPKSVTSTNLVKTLSDDQKVRKAKKSKTKTSVVRKNVRKKKTA